MKLKETSLYIQPETSSEFNYDEIGNDHLGNPYDTPMRSDAFDISNNEKKRNNCRTF